MKFKSGLILGFGAGYVLGAKAGRQRYEDIRRWWNQFTGNPTVQRAADRTKAVAVDASRKGLEVVQTGVEKAGSAVKDRLQKDEPTDRLVDQLETHSGKTPGRNPKTARDAFGGRTGG